MIQLNNTNIRYINLGSTPVEKAFLGDKLIFKTPPYILVWSDAEAVEKNVDVICYTVSGGSSYKYIRRDISAADSPIRIDFGSDEDNINSFKLYAGSVSRVKIVYIDLSKCDSLMAFLGNTRGSTQKYPQYHLTQVELSGNAKEGASMQQFCQGHQVLREINLTGFDILNPSSVYKAFDNCPMLCSINIAGVHIDPVKIDLNGLFSDLQSLEFIDMSGISINENPYIRKYLGLDEGELSYDEYRSLRNSCSNLSRAFENCPNINKIRMSFGWIFLLVTFGYANSVPGIPTDWYEEAKQICSNESLTRQEAMSKLSNLEHLKFSDLDFWVPLIWS